MFVIYKHPESRSFQHTWSTAGVITEWANKFSAWPSFPGKNKITLSFIKTTTWAYIRIKSSYSNTPNPILTPNRANLKVLNEQPLFSYNNSHCYSIAKHSFITPSDTDPGAGSC